jgi:hypothetical protein
VTQLWVSAFPKSIFYLPQFRNITIIEKKHNNKNIEVINSGKVAQRETRRLI